MERMTEKQVAKKTIEKLAIVVVTYKRQQLLATLFESIEKLTVAPWRIIVVDNEHSDKTHGMVEEFSAKPRSGAPPWPTCPATRTAWSTRRRPTTSVVRAVSPQA